MRKIAMLKQIVFDFDGTLADTVEMCLDVYLRVLGKYMGDAVPSREEVYASFGKNEPGILRMYLDDRAPAALEEFCALHREFHRTVCPEPFPGIRELLAELRRRGAELAVVTGRCEATCRISLDMLDLASFFPTLRFGSAERNDKAAQLAALVTSHGFAMEETVYVGDAVSDVLACREAGVRCLSAAWGSSARRGELEAVNPGLVFPTVGALREYLGERLPVPPSGGGVPAEGGSR